MVAKDGDTLAFYKYKERKGDKPFPAGLIVSINDAVVHAPASLGEIIQDGDVVTLDFGIRHRGLFTDHAVTVIAGTAAPEDQRLVDGSYEALAAGIAAAHAGGTTGDIGYAVEQIAKKYKFGYPLNLAGHGVGLSVHEEPFVPNYGTPHSGSRLVEGQVIAIEPMMTNGKGQVHVGKDGYAYRTVDGSRAAQVEHTVLITKNGAEILTKE